jgi:hypothetical protein
MSGATTASDLQSMFTFMSGHVISISANSGIGSVPSILAVLSSSIDASAILREEPQVR